MAVTRFEELIVWQKARTFARDVYIISKEPEFARDFDLVRQVRRSAVSVMANVAEAFERNRPMEFLRYIDISRGSAAEPLSHLYVALDVGTRAAGG